MTSMPLDLPLRCRCARVRGVASKIAPSGGFRFVCYCQDCQAFARFLERPDVLNPAGGTDIFQMPPGRVKFVAGADAVRCLRFSSKVLRWYTDCCRTPIGNTAAGPRFPVVGLIHSFMDYQANGCSREEVSARPSAASTNARPSRRFRRTRLRRPRFGSSPAAHQRFSAGGGVGSIGRRRSSTRLRKHRSRHRACSYEASATV